MNEELTLINRTDEDVVGRWDNIEYVIKAGEERAFGHDMAMHFRNQHPVAGTMDPYGFASCRYKLLIKEEMKGENPEILKLSDNEADELIDRSLVNGEEVTKVRKVPFGAVGRRGKEFSPVDGMFIR